MILIVGNNFLMNTNQSITVSLRYSTAGKLNDCSGVTNNTVIPSISFTSIDNPGRAAKYNKRIKFKTIPMTIPYSKLMTTQQIRVAINGNKSVSKFGCK